MMFTPTPNDRLSLAVTWLNMNVSDDGYISEEDIHSAARLFSSDQGIDLRMMTEKLFNLAKKGQ